MNNTNNNLNILVLDDEVLALDYLVETIEEVQETTTLFQKFSILSTTKQVEFWKLLEDHKPQIIFLDIQMPEKSGIEIAIKINEIKKDLGYTNNLPLIVFSTAFENYGYKAFQVGAVDYLLKPVETDKVAQAFEKIQNLYSNSVKEVKDNIKVSHSGVDVELPIKDVLYFQAEQKYITVVSNKKEFLINNTLLNLKKEFPSFIKIHRSYLINPLYINKFFKKDNQWFLSLKTTDTILPVSRRQRSDIEKEIKFSDLFKIKNIT